MQKINTPILINYTSSVQPSSYGNTGKTVCTMTPCARTAGYIPSYDNFWGTPSSQQSSSDFEKLIQEQIGSEDNAYELTLDEQATSDTAASASQTQEQFDVFDLIDMINPLQHIPVLNYAYRALTGDSIKPISSIIGGAIFAGPAGAASGLVTSVLEQEMGETMPNAILSIASGEGIAHKVSRYETASSYTDIDANYAYNA